MMNEHRRNLAAFGALFGLSLMLTLGAIAWLGPGGRIPVDIASVDAGTRDTSVMALLFPPILVLVLWFMQIPLSWAIGAPLRASPPPGEDIAENTRRYLRMLRFYVIGGCIVAILMQAFVMARAAGIAAPLGLNREGFVRLAFFVFGMLFFYFGNASPKAPYTPTKWIDAARHYRSARFGGWVFAIGGIAVCVLAIAAPFETLSESITPLLFTMMTLPVVRGLVDVVSHRREASRRSD
jgi:hypothetical protein